jgi:hypothetical protein
MLCKQVYQDGPQIYAIRLVESLHLMKGETANVSWHLSETLCNLSLAFRRLHIYNVEYLFSLANLMPP